VTDVLVVPLAAAAALLLVTGTFKLARPAATAGAMGGMGLPGSVAAARLLGAAEVAVGAAALTLDHALAAGAVAVLYAGFAAFVAAAIRRGGMLQTCGCFGALEVPPTTTHLAFDLVATVLAGAAAIAGTPSLWSAAGVEPADGAVLVVVTVIAAGLAVAVLTALPLASTRVVMGGPGAAANPAPVPDPSRRSPR
jgi:hypothetical protein